MKKIFALFLICALTLGMCASCSHADRSASTADATAQEPSTNESLTETSASETETATAAETTEEAESTAPTETTVTEETFTDAKISVRYAEDGMPSEPYDTCVAETGEMQTQLVFTTDATVRDFCVLALTEPDFDDNGQIHFKTSVVYRQDRLTPDRPLVVTTVFFGDIPNNGVSYVDKDGVTRTFSVDMSGEDGSVFLTEIK
ncbi:MAG: hypothetical protein IJT44_12690 [Clostridia bacterium]|nr:hypothetical protein [Clostridia bacterium]